LRVETVRNLWFLDLCRIAKDDGFGDLLP
jgi:hypothetical protein